MIVALHPPRLALMLPFCYCLSSHSPFSYELRPCKGRV